MIKEEKMSAHEKNKVTVFDGLAGSSDKWEIQWGAVAVVKGLCIALGNSLDVNMPTSSATIIDAKDSEGKLKAAVKKNKKTMFYLA